MELIHSSQRKIHPLLNYVNFVKLVVIAIKMYQDVLDVYQVLLEITKINMNVFNNALNNLVPIIINTNQIKDICNVDHVFLIVKAAISSLETVKNAKLILMKFI